MKYYALFRTNEGRVGFVSVDKPTEEEGRDAILEMVGWGKIIFHFPENELEWLRNILANPKTPGELGLTDPGPERQVSAATFRKPTRAPSFTDDHPNVLIDD